MSDIKIVIGAEVAAAEAGLKKVQGELGKTAAISKTATMAFAGVENTAKELSSTLLSSVGPAAALAGIGIATAGAVAWLKIVAKDFISVGNAAELSAQKIKDYKKIVDSATESIAKEASQVAGLLSVLKNEEETRKRKLDAIKELQKLQPEIFAGLKLEKDEVIGLDNAYQSYIENLRSVIAAKIIQAQIEAKVTQLLKIQGAENTKQQQEQLDLLKQTISGNKSLAQIKKDLQNTKLGGGFITDKQESEQVAKLNNDISGLLEKLKEFSKTIKVKEIKVKPEKVTIEIDPSRVAAIGNIKEFEPKLRGPLQTIFEQDVVIKPSVTIEITDKQLKKISDGFTELFRQARIEELAEAFSKQVSDVIQDTITSSITGVADALSNVLAGDRNAIPNLFSGLMSSLGQQVQDLGKFLIKSAITIKIAKEAFQKLLANPIAAAIVGVGLIALGALLKAQASKQYKGFATGVRNFEGGFAMVGERGPERVFLPKGSSVQPNNELSAFSGGGITLMPSIQYSGDGFRIMLDKVDKRWGRNN